jgi:hypothetical protein
VKQVAPLFIDDGATLHELPGLLSRQEALRDDWMAEQREIVKARQRLTSLVAPDGEARTRPAPSLWRSTQLPTKRG